MKINKQAVASIFWMLLLAVGPQVITMLEKSMEAGTPIWKIDFSALTTGIILAGIRFAMNYKNPNDPRYGNDSKNEAP